MKGNPINVDKGVLVLYLKENEKVSELCVGINKYCIEIMQ